MTSGEKRQPVDRELLRQLADVHRVSSSYWDQSGRHVTVDDDVIRDVLAAMGVDTATDDAIVHALHAAQLRDWRRVMPPVFVTWVGEERRLWVHVLHGDSIEAWIDFDDGNSRPLEQLDWWVDPVDVDGRLIGEASFRVPPDLPVGWHEIRVSGPSLQDSCPLAVAPNRLQPETIIGDRQWGLMAQIYAWPSHDSWGVGDSANLEALMTWSSRTSGAGFTLVNPFHAPVLGVPSPYLPSSRRWWNPMMIRPERIEEYQHVRDRDRRKIEKWRVKAQGEFTDPDARTRIDRDRTWKFQARALRLIFECERSSQREQDFDRFCDNPSLVQFATWNVLADRFGSDYRQWPTSFRDAGSPDVAAFAAEHANDVRFQMWLQWIVAQQLAGVQDAAVASGMAIGVMNDLAVGVHPGGADAWALAPVLASGVGVGAPPDMYNQQGQNWDQPPWRPAALAEEAFGPFRDVLRAALHGAGGLRIDHILGLFRMWWIPEGRPATEGTYVGFDHDALLAITCLEAHRAGAVVVGEDLGTVEPWVQHELARRGILGTVISWFERTDSGAPVPVEKWRAGALGSVTVHDLPPSAGYLAGEHVRIRADLGLLSGSHEQERQAADVERHAWARLLRDRGYLSHEANVDVPGGREQMVIGLHRALGACPCNLIGVGAADLVGDARAQNQPGTDQEYPNWRMPIADPDGRPVLLDDFLAAPPPVAENIIEAVRR